jgi:hypothetical protein
VRLLPLLLLLGACASHGATVDRQPNIDGSWSEGTSSLDISGSIATLSFEGRILVFEGVGRLRGTIKEDEVHLSWPGLSITADRDRIEIKSEQGEVKRPLSELPKGSRHRWRDGQLAPG